MIELLVLFIIIFFIIILIFTFINYTSLFLNLIILITSYFLINKDLKDKKYHKYYLIALLLTALFYILSNISIIKSLLVFTEILLISSITTTIIIVYSFAHLVAIIYKYYKNINDKKLIDPIKLYKKRN